MSNVQLYYKILGCTPEDSFQTIKKRYRRLIKEYHPDRQYTTPENESIRVRALRRFMEIQEAYEMILKTVPNMYLV